MGVCGDPGLTVRNTLVPTYQRSHDQCVAEAQLNLVTKEHPYIPNLFTYLMEVISFIRCLQRKSPNNVEPKSFARTLQAATDWEAP